MFSRNVAALTRSTLRANTRVVAKALAPAKAKRAIPAGTGLWTAGVAVGPAGMRRFRLYRPADIAFGERLPLLVMLHGCGQDARTFAASTRMNAIAARERFMVLYPEQDRVSNAQGCWNWFDTSAGRAHGEVSLIMSAIDQVSVLYGVDRARVAVAGLSAGASMAALVATRHPERFKAVVMHSGIPPGTAHSAVSALGAMHGLRRTRPLAATHRVAQPSWPPLLVIHGRGDTTVVPSNGLAAARAWAEAADAKPGAPRVVQRGKRYATDVTDFKARGRVVASLVDVAGLRHAWSGGAAREAFSDAKGPDASRMVWAFAARQFRAAT
jgi:poly(hydroxyalkanoate) depolymerase family esterase